MKASQCKYDINRPTSTAATVGWTVQPKDRWTVVSVEDLDEGPSSELEFLVDVESRRVLRPYTGVDQTASKLEVLVSEETFTETRYFSSQSQAKLQSAKRRRDRLTLPLPLTLRPGHRYRVTVTFLLQGEDACDASATLIRCRHRQKPVAMEFKAVLTKPELKQLLSRADAFIQRPIIAHGGYEFSPVNWFYRNKTPAYYDDVLTRHGGLMLPYLKDNNGDPGCPINRRLDGLFFGVSVTRSTGDLPSTSPFGSRRLCIDWRWMFNAAPNLYFADFYCNTKPHYVTLVMTRNGSKADDFCRRHLIGPLDVHANPLLRLGQNRECAVANANVTVEVFFTENVNIVQLVHAGLAMIYDTASTGTSRPEGIPKRPDCTVCNLYHTTEEVVAKAN